MKTLLGIDIEEEPGETYMSLPTLRWVGEVNEDLIYMFGGSFYDYFC